MFLEAGKCKTEFLANSQSGHRLIFASKTNENAHCIKFLYWSGLYSDHSGWF